MRRKRSLAWRLAGFAVGLLALAAVLVPGWHLARILWWTTHDPVSSAFMQAREAQLRARDPRAKVRHEWVSYERISPHLKRAVIAAEDAKFVAHEGFDWEAIQQAIEKNQRAGRPVAGASTISQQLAKNLFLSGERSWLRKGQEAALTWMIESTMPKRRILEIYLNVAEWGDGVFGAQAAAVHHFGVAARALGPEQAAWLAAVLPSPRRYERGRITPYLASRIEIILARMPDVQIP